MNNQNSFILFHNILLSLVFVFSIVLFSPTIYAMPKGADVQEGEVNINRPTDTQMNITQGTNKGIINWQYYSIAKPETVTYSQPGTSSVTLNRVTGGNPSHIMGTLTANGKLFIVNPNGVLFGTNSHVDVAGLMASTLNISNEDFMDGNYVFKENADDIGASVINKGYIQAKTVALTGQSVKNEGKIVTTLGKVTLASGSKMTLNLDTAGMISVAIDEGVKQKVIRNGEEVKDGVKNTGTIKADGGKVVLTAKALDDVFDYAVNNEGIVEAKSLDTSNGKVVLKANQRVNVAGEINAEGGEVVVDSQGADFSGSIIKCKTGIYNMNDGDTSISGTFSGNQTWWDEENIFIEEEVVVNGGGHALFLADHSRSSLQDWDDGSGNVIFERSVGGGPPVVGSVTTNDGGDITLAGADIVFESPQNKIDSSGDINLYYNSSKSISQSTFSQVINDYSGTLAFFSTGSLKLDSPFSNPNLFQGETFKLESDSDSGGESGDIVNLNGHYINTHDSNLIINSRGDETDTITLTDVDTHNVSITITAGGTVIATDVQSVTNIDEDETVGTIDITAGGDLTATNIVAGAEGDVNLTTTGSGNNLILSGNITAVNDTVSLSASGDIVDNTGSDSTVHADTLRITDAEKVGLKASKLYTRIRRLEAEANDNIYIEEVEDGHALGLGKIISANGSIDIKTAGTGNITLYKTDGVLTANSGNVSLNATDGNLVLKSSIKSGNTVNLTASGDINSGDILVDDIEAGNQIRLRASNGKIKEYPDDTGNDLTSSEANLKAADGIVGLSPIETSLDTLEAHVAGTGDIEIDNDKAINLTDVDTADGLIDISADGSVLASGTGNHVVTDSGDAELRALSGVVGTVDSPINVDITGDLTVKAKGKGDTLVDGSVTPWSGTLEPVSSNIEGSVAGTTTYTGSFAGDPDANIVIEPADSSFPPTLDFDPPGYVFFNDTEIWPELPLPQNTDYTTPNSSWPTPEVLSESKVHTMSRSVNRGVIFGYHPVTPTDSSAFEEYEMSEDMYEFIEGELKMKEGNFFSWFEEEIKEESEK